MKGLLIAGGRGTRLWPLTDVISKQLLPIYDKPLIYYPLATLMAAGIRDISLVCTPEDLQAFEKLFGAGDHLGLQMKYFVQEKPLGIAHAIKSAESTLRGEKCAVVLGDNIFHGSGLGRQLNMNLNVTGAKIFAYRVSNPSDYGVVGFDKNMSVTSLEEKPSQPKSNYAVPGLYFYDEQIWTLLSDIRPSARGEYEITDVNKLYMEQGALEVSILPRGVAWLDTGSANGLHDAATYVRILEERQGTKVACLEEIALVQGWISIDDISQRIGRYPNGTYSDYLKSLII